MIRRLVLAIVSTAFCIGIKAQTPDEVISQFKSLQVFNVENRIAGISYPDGCPVKPDDRDIHVTPCRFAASPRGTEAAGPGRQGQCDIQKKRGA